mmetsp:Transcript_90777/g.265721  ORF Transcript_90777/g.265721 Transcript_90777/m.265721 type:complete len:151 (-) Transcript_90777:184-636(-)
MTEAASPSTADASATDPKSESQPGKDPPPSTVKGVLYNYVTSPATALSVFGLLSVGFSSGGIDTATFMLACLAGGLLAGAWLVTKMENSEWRKELRRSVEAKERELGISHKSKVESAMSMGLSMPPPPMVPDAPDKASSEEKAPTEKKED